jgi:hypothetical protein
MTITTTFFLTFCEGSNIWRKSNVFRSLQDLLKIYINIHINRQNIGVVSFQKRKYYRSFFRFIGEDRLIATVDGSVVSPEVSVHFQSCL